jgi:hypothetical protein
VRLEEIVDDYAYVLTELRDAKLPDAFAAIPYWESSCRAEARSFLCAQGYWQLMPEVAHRMNVEVKDCKLRGSDTLWSPVDIVPAMLVKMNAPYVDPEGPSCRIQGCAIDERKDLQVSTRAAVSLLAEAWDDPVLRDSGAAVQLTILSHHAGYDDSRFYDGREKRTNIKTAYQRWLANSGSTKGRSPTVYGDNIKCSAPNVDEWCGSVFDPATQHYAYNILAEHILAVCYYAMNYDDLPVFKTWKDYVVGDGYCLRIDVPTQEEVKKWAGAAPTEKK